jgi:hypothetical protein
MQDENDGQEFGESPIAKVLPVLMWLMIIREYLQERRESNERWNCANN